MNVSEIESFSKLLLDFTDQPDQVFVNQFLPVLNYVYTWEIANYTNSVDPTLRKRTLDLTWPTDQITYSIPAVLQNSQVLSVFNITSPSVSFGVKLFIGRDNTESTIFFKDALTWQWGLAGPPSDQTIRFEYLPAAESLTFDTDVPALIPAQYHYLLAWRVATVFKALRSGIAPPAWMEEVRALRENMLTAMVLSYDDKMFPRQLNNITY